MKSIKDLVFGFGDAENYLRRQNKDLFNRVFVKNQYLDQILDPNRFFLIGEKGTGKTAYSVYLTNNPGYRECVSYLKYLRETDYAKFLKMKQSNDLCLSEYSDIWMVIILFLLASILKEDELDESSFSRPRRIRILREVCLEYHQKAFAPEIAQALQFVEQSNSVVKVLSGALSAQIGDKRRLTSNESAFQLNLMYLQRQFLEAFKDLKLKRNHLLFIDGIDIRPGDIPYSDYLECVRGLAYAVWRLNTDCFPAFRDSAGRFRVVMLLRPDIFNSLNFQNATNKLRDNSIYLCWNTPYNRCESSELFRVSDRILACQQRSYGLTIGDAWHAYFPWKMKDIKPKREHDDVSFVQFLKMSYCRPRDIVSALALLQEAAARSGYADESVFPATLMADNSFLDGYSESLMSGVKDQLSFYYTEKEYQLFRNFFMCLEGRNQFDYEFFVNAVKRYEPYVQSQSSSGMPQFLSSPESFLQFLYDINVIAYKEITDRGNFFRWCYRERRISNLSPKVEVGGTYVVHYGLLKALNLGYARRIA